MKNEKSAILVVEDNPTQQLIIRLLLERYGFEAVIVNSGREAIDAVSLCITCFSAILMDVKMADMDGFECTRAVREIEATMKRRTPIVAVTAHVAPTDRKKCLDAGMDDYISKPFAVDDFRRILLRWTYVEDRPNLKLLPSRTNYRASEDGV